MGTDARWRLICYDIRDPKRYRRVFKVLRGTAHSVQYSIFRARLTDREAEELRWELAKVMEPEDALLIVDLCPTCANNVVSRNHVGDWTVEPAAFTILGTGNGPMGVRKTAAETARKAAESHDKLAGSDDPDD